MTVNKKFHIRIYDRAIIRLQKNGLNDAINYVIVVFSGNPEQTNTFIDFVKNHGVEPFSSLVIGALKVKKQLAEDKRIKKVIVHQQKFNTQEFLAAENIKNNYVTEFESLKKHDMQVLYLASIPPIERDKLGTVAQRKQAKALRVASLRSTAVKQQLGCSDTELKRWSEDGRLPILFRRRMSTGAVTLAVRHWACEVVQEALPLLSDWRQEDALAKKLNRAAARAARRS